MSTPHDERQRSVQSSSIGDPLLRQRPLPPVPPLPPEPPASDGPSRTRTKRRHPAKGSRAVALVVSIGSTAGLTASFYHADSSDASALASATSVSVGAEAAASPSPNTTPPIATAPSNGAPITTPNTAAPAPAKPTTTAPKATAPPTTARASSLADGTFTGQTFTNRWGAVQVRVTISGGRITDVAELQSPGGRSRSVQISSVSAPILRSEALTAQSAKIHTVSGATYTSTGYKQSLQSALDLAHA